MKASELRIGNYYNAFGILEVCDGNLITSLQQIEQANKICVDVEPTPLTEEWLVKFDWDRESMEDGLICYDLVYDDIINQYHFYIYSVGGNKINCALIKHVHQLQNLYFALTNTELKIKE